MCKRAEFLPLLPDILIREVEAGRAAIVGGAVRSQFEGRVPKDVDVFVFEKSNHERLTTTLGAQPKEGSDGFVSILASEITIEIVHLPEWNSPSECLKRADFDVAAGVYSAGKFYLPDGYEKAIACRKMRFLGTTEDPQRSYDRFLKYNRKYGYTIDSSIEALLRLWQNN